MEDTCKTCFARKDYWNNDGGVIPHSDYDIAPITTKVYNIHMIKRMIEKKLFELLGYYPVVVLTGPRQSGKTTLLKSLFPDREYFNLENPSDLALLETDPVSFIELHSKNIIIDEAQKFPQLFSYIQTSVDNDRESGRIILSGSQNILLSETISQTLAGRAAYCELLPLTQTELYNASILRLNPDIPDLFENMFKGSYPGQRSDEIPPDIFFNQYIATYVERDVRSIKNVSDLATFRSFIRILAGRIGQLLDYTSLANDTGVSPGTIKNWISILEASYIVKILRPLHNNFGKRYIKSPKIYFLDTGLACRLLGIKQSSEIESHYLRGNLFENYIIAELHKEISSRNIDTEMFFYRDAKQNEVDLILRDSDRDSAVEIKSSSGFSSSMLAGLHFWKNLSAQKIKSHSPKREIAMFLIYAGETETVGDIKLLPWNSVYKDLNIK